MLIFEPDSGRSGSRHYIQNWKDLDLSQNPLVSLLGLGPNLVTRLLVTLGSNKYQMQWCYHSIECYSTLPCNCRRDEIHEMVKKWGRGQQRFYISRKYPCTLSFMVKILLVKLKNLYIQYAWISIIKKQNHNQHVKVEKVVVFVKTFDH